MRSRGNLEIMKLNGTVKNGLVAVDLPDGTIVTLEVDTETERGYQLDRAGRLVMTPELETSIRAGEAEADGGLGISVDELEQRLRESRR